MPCSVQVLVKVVPAVARLCGAALTCLVESPGAPNAALPQPAAPRSVQHLNTMKASSSIIPHQFLHVAPRNYLIDAPYVTIPFC